MMHRYLFIEPLYSDPDTFCNITVGSGRVRANIQIYIDEYMLADVVWALRQTDLKLEHPRPNHEAEFDDFDFHLSVLASAHTSKIVRFRVCQGGPDDGAPFFSDIRFQLSEEEATELAGEMEKWLLKRECILKFWC